MYLLGHSLLPLLQDWQLQVSGGRGFGVLVNRLLYKHIQFTGAIHKQEAHGPQLAHLSETATADMQMACNIFPILL